MSAARWNTRSATFDDVVDAPRVGDIPHAHVEARRGLAAQRLQVPPVVPAVVVHEGAHLEALRQEGFDQVAPDEPPGACHEDGHAPVAAPAHASTSRGIEGREVRRRCAPVAVSERSGPPWPVGGHVRP